MYELIMDKVIIVMIFALAVSGVAAAFILCKIAYCFLMGVPLPQ